jgi:hypothetical protein
MTKPAIPETVTYQRGQFTFKPSVYRNQVPWVSSVSFRREADRDIGFWISRRAGVEFVGQRISRIAANDLHPGDIQRGGVNEEVLIPFQEIHGSGLNTKTRE